MLSCKAIGELLSQKLDRRLSLRERLRLKFHLLICKTCRCYEKQLKFIAHAVQRLMQSSDGAGMPPLSEEAGRRINRNIRQQLNEENSKEPRRRL